MSSSPNDAEEAPPLPPNWDRCHAYNHRKRRYCRQVPVPSTQSDGPRYCGNHMHLMDDDGSPASKRSKVDPTNNTNIKASKKERGRRIPCPIDSSHLIFESALQKHVLVCPAVKHEQDVASQEYYSKDVNRGGFGEMSKGSVDNDLVEKGHQELALAVLCVFCQIFRSESSTNEQLKSLTEQDIYSAIPELDLSYAEENIPKEALENEEQVTGRLSGAIKLHRIKAGGARHVHQIASILGHVRQNNLLPCSRDDTTSESLNVVEMGAGRGMLGLIVAGAAAVSSPISKVQLYLVDRSGSRAKAETKIRTASNTGTVGDMKQSECLNLDTVDVKRIKADLAHVHMPTALPFLTDATQIKTGSKSMKTVVIAKHLCGSGTDLALKSLCSIASTGSINGCVMATCCHGLCDWNDYTGRDTLLSLFCHVGGLSCFSEQEFDVMKRWTSASVLEDRCMSSDDAEDDHTVSIETNDKSSELNAFTVVQKLGLACGGNGLGRACQRIIDYGRTEYMRNNLFCMETDRDKSNSYDVKLFHYVSRKVTPQNALLIAYRK